MTVQELNQLHYLDLLIQKQCERLQDLRDEVDVKAQVISDMPRSGGAKDKLGEVVPQIVDLRTELEKEIADYANLKRRLSRYIDTIDDARIKLIMIMRFIDQKPWMMIADELGGKETEYSVKNACYRYLERRREPRVADGQISIFE